MYKAIHKLYKNKKFTSGNFKKLYCWLIKMQSYI